MSVEVTAKLDRLPQLALGARLDLPDALAREVQAVADLLQGSRFVVFESEDGANLMVQGIKAQQESGQELQVAFDSVSTRGVFVSA